MTNTDYFYGSRFVFPLPAVALTSATVTNGVAISLDKATTFAYCLKVTNWVSGSVKIQDIQVADDNAFTTNVVTFSASSNPNQVIGNDHSQVVDAFTQSLLSANGEKAIYFRSLGINNQAFVRARLVSTGTVDLTAQVVGIKLETEAPIIQG